MHPERGAVPAFVRGRLTPRAAIDQPPPLAIAVNGTVAATTQAFIGDDGQVQFGVLLPQRAFQVGMNRIEVLGIIEGGTELVRFEQ